MIIDGPRKFSPIELISIKELKNFMSTAFDVESWNYMRAQAQLIWDEKIISAVDGLHKWAIKYDKSTKTVSYIGLKFK